MNSLSCNRFGIKQKDGELYETYIAGDYDENSCSDNKNDCPKTLIGSLSGTIVNEVLLNKTIQDLNKTTLDLNQGIPYPVIDSGIIFIYIYRMRKNI